MSAQEKKPETKLPAKPRTLKTLLAWTASERPFRRRDREYFTTMGAIVFLLAVILIFLQEWLLIAVIAALMFVAYIMATIEPRKVNHQLTNRGIITGGKNYNWEDLSRFWFEEKGSQKILSRYLLLEEPEKTWIDNASEWLSRRVPLETSS